MKWKKCISKERKGSRAGRRFGRSWPHALPFTGYFYSVLLHTFAQPWVPTHSVTTALVKLLNLPHWELSSLNANPTMVCGPEAYTTLPWVLSFLMSLLTPVSPHSVQRCLRAPSQLPTLLGMITLFEWGELKCEFSDETPVSFGRTSWAGPVTWHHLEWTLSSSSIFSDGHFLSPAHWFRTSVDYFWTLVKPRCSGFVDNKGQPFSEMANETTDAELPAAQLQKSPLQHLAGHSRNPFLNENWGALQRSCACTQCSGKLGSLDWTIAMVPQSRQQPVQNQVTLQASNKI